MALALRAANESAAEVVSAGCAEQRNLSGEVGDYNISCQNVSVPRAARVREMDSFRILLYSLIFLLSVFGNLLIIVVLVLNKRMRTVTNSFLLSLAVSDLMMAVFCIPFTFIPNILEDFIFGGAMCKTVSYFMGISVSISTFSLVAIAIERYSAICNPLKSRAWQTRSHAYRVIAATWLVSLLLMVPYPVFSLLKSFPKANGTVTHTCRMDWPSGQAEQTWYVLLLFTLFFIPGVVMIVAYGLISRELFRGMQFELGQSRETTGQKNGVGRAAAGSSNDDDDGCYIQVSRSPPRRGAAHPLGRVQRRPGQGRARPQQHLGGQAAGQEAGHPHADGHRGALLRLLDAAVLGQHVEGLRPEVGLRGAVRSAHLLHPPAVLHLGVRQPHHLLLHELALPQSPAVHLRLLLPRPPLPLVVPEEGGGRRGRHRRHVHGHFHGHVHVQVQLHHRQHRRHLLGSGRSSRFFISSFGFSLSF
uniref:Gastrin/cholecystokinin type B receptor n=1 Tax=Gasterosteus aculeatus aculeatus TaxID=481459 RepID=A0AAQ4PUC2_GASAC